MEQLNNNSSSRSNISAKKLREMKKKALQSYKKIPTIKQRADKEMKSASETAERDLNNFIQKL